MMPEPHKAARISRIKVDDKNDSSYLYDERIFF